MNEDGTFDVAEELHELQMEVNGAFTSLKERGVDGERGVNLVDGLFAIAREIGRVADALNKLGLNGADTQMGAIEALSKEIKEGASLIAETVRTSGT